MVHRQVEHLVKVTIVHCAVPAHGKRVPAHHATRGGGIERIDQRRHVFLRAALLLEERQEARDGHVRDCEELIEYDVVLPLQLALPKRFQLVL